MRECVLVPLNGEREIEAGREIWVGLGYKVASVVVPTELNRRPCLLFRNVRYTRRAIN